MAVEALVRQTGFEEQAIVHAVHYIVTREYTQRPPPNAVATAPLEIGQGFGVLMPGVQGLGLLETQERKSCWSGSPTAKTQNSTDAQAPPSSPPLSRSPHAPTTGFIISALDPQTQRWGVELGKTRSRVANVLTKNIAIDTSRPLFTDSITYRPNVAALLQSLAEQPVHNTIHFIAQTLPSHCCCMRVVVQQSLTHFNGGDRMSSELPMCVENVKNQCARCGAQRSDEVKLKACAGCKMVLYCSRQCQTKDWDGHKDLCRKMAEAPAASKAAQPAAVAAAAVAMRPIGAPNFAASAPIVVPAAAAAAARAAAAPSTAAAPVAGAAASFAAFTRNVGSLSVNAK